MISESVTLDKEDNWNSKINKKVLTVRKFKTVPEPALDIAARRARDEEIAKKY
jgi:hypothetical protein